MTNDLEIIGGADVFSGNSHMLIFVKRYNNAALSTNYFWHYFWNWAYLCYKQKQSDREGCLMKTPTIETDRLILREVHKEDTDDIFACWMQDEDVSRYMCWKASDDITKTKEFIQRELKQIENDKWNRWIIVLKESGNKSGLSAFENYFGVYGQTKAKRK